MNAVNAQTETPMNPGGLLAMIAVNETPEGSRALQEAMREMRRLLGYPPAPSSPLDRMIDEAVGIDREVIAHLSDCMDPARIKWD